MRSNSIPKILLDNFHRAIRIKIFPFHQKATERNAFMTPPPFPRPEKTKKKPTHPTVSLTKKWEAKREAKIVII